MGFLLGMMEDMEYEEKSLVLEPGDTLVLFTDGVFESPDAEGKLFGREGILRSIASRLGAGRRGALRRPLLRPARLDRGHRGHRRRDDPDGPGDRVALVRMTPKYEPRDTEERVEREQ